MPLKIDATEDFLQHQESMTSPIVINDKMLSHSAVSPSPASIAAVSAAALPITQITRPQPTVFRGNREQKINNIDAAAFGSFIDTDALNKILMDLTPSQDYEANLF